MEIERSQEIAIWNRRQINFEAIAQMHTIFKMLTLNEANTKRIPKKKEISSERKESQPDFNILESCRDYIGSYKSLFALLTVNDCVQAMKHSTWLSTSKTKMGKQFASHKMCWIKCKLLLNLKKKNTCILKWICFRVLWQIKVKEKEPKKWKRGREIVRHHRWLLLSSLGTLCAYHTDKWEENKENSSHNNLLPPQKKKIHIQHCTHAYCSTPTAHQYNGKNCDSKMCSIYKFPIDFSKSLNTICYYRIFSILNLFFLLFSFVWHLFPIRFGSIEFSAEAAAAASWILDELINKRAKWMCVWE